ncbi:MAG: rubrerythrin family protein [Candidatus Krumholzibacteriia bacterium]
MAHDDLAALLDAAIGLELAISRLYLRFHHDLPGDADFWWQLAMEEKNHAALLRSVDMMATTAAGVPDGLLPGRVQELRDLVARIEECLVRYAGSPAARDEAFALALELEQSAGEAHFQNFMESDGSGSLARVFQSLNRADMDHAQRLRSYMTEQGLA